MKKTILLLAANLTLFASTVNATQWSVSNSPFNPGQFISLATAVASSSVVNGDTLLIHPTVTSYGNITLSKSLVMIGAGFNTQKTAAQIAIIGQITSTTPAAVSGSKFYGLRISQFNGTSGSGNLSNVTFEDCLFDGNIALANSVIPVNMIVRNCVFTATGNYNIELGQTNPNAGTILVSHCLFANTFISNRSAMIVRNCLFVQGAFSGVQNATFENCIFRSASLAVSGVTNCTFNNCISAISTLPPASNTGSNNVAPAAVICVNAPGNSVNLTHDYHLTPASPGYTAGNDGQQLGLFGGNSTFSNYGEPLNSAIVRSLNITNSVIPVNGTLNINATITKPNGQ